LLLLITGSEDGTSALIVQRLQKKVFRFNYDLFADYSLVFTPTFWEIKNPTGHSISSETVTSCFWWKAFNFYILDQEQFIVEEVKYVFRELYHHCRIRGLVKGNPHDFHNHLGKINILSIARRYFKVPETLLTFQLAGLDKVRSHEIVAKSLTSGLTTTNKALFTTKVERQKLHPNYPWFLQEMISSDSDITIFTVGDKIFAFERSRKSLKGLDWRSEQDFNNLTDQWDFFNLGRADELSVRRFLADLKVNWGRLDLMRSKNGELIFLEYNANGQWAFLDYEDKYGLLDAVLEYLYSDA
jgi:hypothetical protein